MTQTIGDDAITCPQAAWSGFAKIIPPHIGAATNEMLVCGMALGYADETDVVNTRRGYQLMSSLTGWSNGFRVITLLAGPSNL